MDCLEIPVIWHVWCYTSVVAHVLIYLYLDNSNNAFIYTQAPQFECEAKDVVSIGEKWCPWGPKRRGVAAAGRVS